MTNAEIAERLEELEAVFTPVQRVRNEIVRVHEDAVIVCSVRTDRERSVPFADIRNAASVTRHGSVVRGLHEAVFAERPRPAEAPRSLVEFAPDEPRPEGTPQPERMLTWYREARSWVDENTDWVDSVAWSRDAATLTAEQFLAEYAWAVYVSGFKANTVDTKWAELRKAWRGFNPGEVDKRARRDALRLIAHKSKTRAILQIARMITRMDWPPFKATYVVDACSIGRLPWMRPANRRFLARNLRLADVGKPDRWLVRFAERFGYDSVDEALEVLEADTGDNPGLADAYIWAYLSERPGALD